MSFDDDQFLEVTESFQNAALDGGSWHSALRSLAHATGSRSGELIGLGSDATVPFNIVTDIDPLFVQDFVAMGGGNPQLNPRVGAGNAVRPLTVLTESDFIRHHEYREHRLMQHLASRWDLAYSCLTPLERHDGILVGLAVVRSNSEGHITNEQRAVFTAAAPHVRAAVRTQLALEGNGAAILAGAMDALSIPAFVCDRSGTVKAMTGPAETLASTGRHLMLKLGRLLAASAEDSKSLSDAIDAATVLHTRPQRLALRTVIVRAPEAGGEPLALDVIALPSRHYEFLFTPRVLVIARGSAGRDRRRDAILQAAYALTAAETDIALRLVEGHTVEAIAGSRRVSVATIRAQIKAVLAKVGVKRQIELVSRLRQLGL
jgi:DNA-binding CsgD family transcriptional regulator